jgi:hypothetical protein
MTRVRMADHDGDDYAVQPYLTMRKGENGYPYRTGVFWSRHGFVDIYSQPPLRKQSGITSMRFIHDGRIYSRRWQTEWPDRTIARLAREFADEIATPRPFIVPDALESGVGETAILGVIRRMGPQIKRAIGQ